MPVRPDLQQFEKCIDDALKKNDFKPLMTLLQIDICEDVKIKCSKQFLRKLDDLICREIILSQQQSKDEAVMNMTEDLFDLLMVIYDTNDEGKKQVLESFIPHICALVIDSRVNFCIQQEALKKLNLMLDRIPQDANKILSNQEILTLMSNMGERILDVGDYELQVGIVEALCRMTTEKRRQKLAYEWFSMDFIANAFKEIKDCEFETDCRIFLNLVNGMLGDRRRVFTFPCLSAFLGKYELQIPSDEKLEEFWIDFNLGSHTLSFYIAGDNEDHQWEAVTVPEEKVLMYNIEVRESKKLLTLTLKTIVKISKKEGKELLLYFDESLEITNVTEKLFGGNKYKEFTRKQGISVAKTSIHILFDASGSQILVPESQPSPVKENLIHLKEKSNFQKKLVNPLEPDNTSSQDDRKNSQDEITTPSRKKMSEASMIVPDTDRYTVRSPILLINTSTPRRSREPLQAINSAEKAVSKTSESGMDYAVSLKSRQSDGRNKWNNRTNRNKTTAVVQNKEYEDNESPDQNFNEIKDTLSEAYAVEKVDKPVLPGVLDISKNKSHSRWACWTPVTTITLCNNQRTCALPGDTSTQDTGVNKKCTTQKSVSDDDSEETQRVKYTKDVIKCNNSDEAEICEINIQEQNHPKYSQKKNTANAKKNDWGIESEMTYKSVLLNKTTEESLIYKKTCVLSKDVNTTICDKNPSRKSMRSHTKSRKELTSELTSCELEEIPVKENSKEKRFTGAPESLINQINKRYNPNDNMISTRKLMEPRDGSGFSKKPDPQFSKVQRKSYRKLKTTVVNVTTECPLNDVYNFSLNGADEPVIKLGIQEFQATTREASTDNSLKLVDVRNHDEHDPSLKTKEKKMLSHEKKTLFSDSETDCECDGKTDVSWLREPKSKRLMDYRRNKNTKKYKSRKSRSSMEKGEPRSKMVLNKNSTKKDYEVVVDGRARLPRRATKTKKNYKDLSTSESDLESKKDFSYLFKDKLPTKEETVHSRAQTKKLPKKQQKVFNSEVLKEQSSEEQKNSSKLRDGREDSLYLPSASVSGSSSSVEVMRCTEKITEKDFTQDYDYITKSLSPYPKAVSPEFLNGNNRVAGQGKSPRISETSAICVRKSCSPASGLPFSPKHILTKNNSVVNTKNADSVIKKQRMQHCDSYSDVSSNSSEKLYMGPESPDSCETHMQSKREEHHTVSPLSLSSEKLEKIWFDMPSDNTHVSGPSQRGNKRRMYLEEDELSNSNEAEVEEAEEREHMLSKKLCERENSDQHAYKTSLSTPDFSVPEDWQQESQGAGMFCDNISSDYKRKIDTQHKIMDDFTTKTLKLTQQHLMAMTYQARGHRDENIDKFQVTLLDELEKAEKDSQTLRDLEKELVDIEEKLVQKMRAYHRSERERFRVLKTSLDKSFLVYNSVCEETVFTSEMCLMKANMKMLQDKLLKEMHEEELLNIRRGLESLFKAH